MKKKHLKLTLSIVSAAVLIVISIIILKFFLYSNINKQIETKDICAKIINTSHCEGPNILLISIDTLRADHVGCYGYHRDTTPNLDKIASESVLFTQAISPASWTTPAHMSIFTALYPIKHNVLNTKMKLNIEVITLAKVLQGHGYMTGACISAPTMLPADLGFSRGFDTYDDYTVGIDVDMNMFGLNDLYGGQNSHPICPITHSMATTFLEGRGKGKFFLFIHYWDIHGNYDAPQPYKKMFDKDYEGNFDGSQESINKIKPGIAKRDLEHMIARYDGEIRYVDDYIGKLMDKLRELNLLDKTLLIITADHGEEFLEHGGNWHGKTLYDEVIHVPLIIRYPSLIPQNNVITTQVSTVSIMPTILDIVDIPLEHQVQGESLLPLIIAETQVPIQPVYSEMTKNEKRAIRADDFKFIGDFENDERQLFDLKKDSREYINLIDKETEIAGDLEKKLLRWIKASRSSTEKPAELDEQTKQRLKSLGYLQ
ncbi:sulfatase [Candidatus Pacearchaeota archaeon]|nr:sulfatase [Candidatus Pacearchaeota archaeon]